MFYFISGWESLLDEYQTKHCWMAYSQNFIQCNSIPLLQWVLLQPQRVKSFKNILDPNILRELSDVNIDLYVTHSESSKHNEVKFIFKNYAITSKTSQSSWLSDFYRLFWDAVYVHSLYQNENQCCPQQ